MRAYLIDPSERTLTVVDYDGDYRSISKLIGCETFTAAGFGDEGDIVYVDDEGLFKGPTSFFLIEGHPQPLAGKGLVLGSDREGNSGDQPGVAPSEVGCCLHRRQPPRDRGIPRNPQT